jgi:hypothetical protein
MLSPADLDRIAARRGYAPIGGMATNRAYRHATRPEVLKVALAAQGDARDEALGSFRQCAVASARYAASEIMPAALEIGSNWAGTGLPYLREQLVDGPNLAAAYLDDPAFWERELPREIVRIYGIIAEQPAVDVTETWTEKLAGVADPPGYEALAATVRAAGEWLRERAPRGWPIHGDLQWGNMVARRRPDGTGQITLIDWEMAEVMPLGYEFAMLYEFLHDPGPQVPAALRPAYAARRPLHAVWHALAPQLWGELALSPTELLQSVRFRMRVGQLERLDRAVRAGDAEGAERIAQALADELASAYFARLPIGD